MFVIRAKLYKNSKFNKFKNVQQNTYIYNSPIHPSIRHCSGTSVTPSAVITNSAFEGGKCGENTISICRRMVSHVDGIPVIVLLLIAYLTLFCVRCNWMRLLTKLAQAKPRHGTRSRSSESMTFITEVTWCQFKCNIITVKKYYICKLLD